LVEIESSGNISLTLIGHLISVENPHLLDHLEKQLKTIIIPGGLMGLFKMSDNADFTFSSFCIPYLVASLPQKLPYKIFYTVLARDVGLSLQMFPKTEAVNLFYLIKCQSTHAFCRFVSKIKMCIL